MDISVIVPTWNRRELVSRAIESALNQTHPAREIIVVDDGSTDGTAEMVARRFPTIKVLRQKNKGVSAARNAGIRHVKHDWIALLDSDDEWLPDKLRHQQILLDGQSDMRACHTEEIWMRAGKRVNAMDKHAKPEGWIYQQCLPLCCVSPSSILLSRSVLDDVGLFDESLPACEDYDLWLRIFRKYQVALVKEPMLVKYGGHSDQLSKKFWGMDRFRVKALVKSLQEGKLDSEQFAATIEMLGQKCRVLINGFRKRGKHDQVQYYSDICEKWGIALQSC